ncbi:hypothetical protein DL89DRAFT_263959 [Linderina pennispora]|uniref:Uncharacterized protein n=1 Tax=Linderina pennispora TaxID=61395 RepID=A0A1Y1WKF5_9FUNG|nr:uncharacterized protein DL89DRAFT_263959 [Linderina pennispora]ORX73953.1 hypothetical protein DL89DRAFT_263959 [Linderina pennispora]
MSGCAQGALVANGGNSYWIAYNGTVQQVWKNIDTSLVNCTTDKDTLSCCYSNECKNFVCPGDEASSSDYSLLSAAMQQAANVQNTASSAGKIRVGAALLLTLTLLPFALA